jgi:hypothetical protein
MEWASLLRRECSNPVIEEKAKKIESKHSLF